MDKLENKKIAIIGVGHMGNAIIQGLLNSGFKRENLIFSKKSKTNRKVAARANWILIAVKPMSVESVIANIHDLITDKLILSVAGGVTISNIQEYSNKKQKIIRLMPNIPVAINSGVIGMYSSKNVSEDLKNNVKKIFSTLGTIFEVNREDDLDNLTLISSCGPGFVSYFIEVLTKSGESLGLSRKVSEKAVLETIKGTLLYVQKNNITFTDLQRQVATKGGITEEIVKSLDKYKFESIFAKSMGKGYSKLNTLKMNLKGGETK